MGTETNRKDRHSLSLTRLVAEGIDVLYVSNDGAGHAFEKNYQPKIVYGLQLCLCASLTTLLDENTCYRCMQQNAGFQPLSFLLQKHALHCQPSRSTLACANPFAKGFFISTLSNFCASDRARAHAFKAPLTLTCGLSPPVLGI